MKSNKKYFTRIKQISIIVAILTLLVVSSFFLSQKPKPTQAGWFNDGWTYRTEYRINNSGAAVSNQQVLLQIGTSTLISNSKLQSNCNDSRFTDASGNILQYYVNVSGGAGIGCNDASTDYYILLPNINAGATLIYHYYGNPSALRGSNVQGHSVATFSPASSSNRSEEQNTTVPTLYWSFDDATGTTSQDGSSQNNDGTLAGTTTPIWHPPTDCVSGSCLEFSNGYSRKTYSSDVDLDPGTGSFSVGLWFKMPTTTIASDEVIFSRNDTGTLSRGFEFQVYSSTSKLCFIIDDDATWTPDDQVCSTGAVNDGQWHHAMGVKSTTASISLYMDGKLAETKTGLTATGSLSATSNPFYIGTDADGTGGPYIGYVDEVKYYVGVAKSAAEVASQYASRGNHNGSGSVQGESDANQDLSSGLVGYWKMDESSWTVDCSTSSVTDSSGNGNNGKSCPVTTGPAGGAAGKYSYAGIFDGSDDAVNVADSDTLDLSTNKSITISAWINKTGYASFSNGSYIVDKQNIGSSAGYNFLAGSTSGCSANGSSSDYLCFLISDGTNTYYMVTTSTLANDSVWHHVAAVLDRTNETNSNIFIDGYLQPVTRSGTLSAVGNVSNTNDLCIGKDLSGPSCRTDTLYSMNGKLDDIRVYNRALSGKEIEYLSNWSPGPIAYWKMDENTGLTAYDSSGNANTGTIASAGNWQNNGKYGASYFFDALNASINAGSGTSLDDLPAAGLSLSTWIFPRSMGEGSAGFILAKNVGTAPSSGWYLGLTGTNALTFQVDGATDLVHTTNSNAITLNAWNHVEVSWDGTITTASTAKIYVNGIESTYATTTNGATRVTDATSSLFIGNDSTSARTFDGRIDDIRIYNYPRSSRQILEDMNGGHPLGGSPVASQTMYWNLDEQQGSTANNTNPVQSSLTGTTSGTAWLLPNNCQINGCINVDTNSDSVSGGDVTFTDSLTGMTASVWLNPQTITTDDTILSKSTLSTQNSFLIRTDTSTSSEIRVYIASSVSDTTNYALTSGLGLTTGSWQHLAIVYDGTQGIADRIKIYKNGKQITTSVTGTIPTSMTTGSTSNLKLGDSDITGSEALLSYYDELKIYSAPLSPSEILVDMNANSAVSYGKVLGTKDNEGFGGNPPIRYWNLDENSGTATNDKSGTTSTAGTLEGGALWSIGKNNSAIFFDDTNDDVLLGTTAVMHGGSAGTLSAWVYPNTNYDDADIAYSEDSAGDSNTVLQLNIGGGGFLGFNIDQSGGTWKSCTDTNVLVPNTWYYVSGTYDTPSHTIEFYVNGIKVCTNTTWDGTFRGTINKAYLGRTTSTGNYWSGRIDDVKIYNYVRTPAQIVYDYNRGAPIAQYNFDECAGAVAYNSAVNANNQAMGMNGTITPGASGNTATGSCNSGTTTEMWDDGVNVAGGRTGKFENALGFDGTDDYVDIADDSKLRYDASTENFSVFAWVKRNATGAEQYIVNKLDAANDGWFLRYDAANTITCGVNATTFSSTATVTDTTWHHVGCIFDRAGNGQAYIDGKATGTATSISGLTMATTSVMRMAARSYTITSYLNGVLDDVRIYNYVPPSPTAWVQRLYNEGSAVRFGPSSGNP